MTLSFPKRTWKGELCRAPSGCLTTMMSMQPLSVALAEVNDWVGLTALTSKSSVKMFKTVDIYLFYIDIYQSIKGGLGFWGFGVGGGARRWIHA